MASEDYDFNNKYRGTAVIIANIKFDDHRNDRPGAEIDYKKMCELFKQLDFRVKGYKNRSAAEMMDKIKKALRKKKRHEQSDCFALVISTHGSESAMAPREKKKQGFSDEAIVWRHTIYGNDDNPVYVDEIMDLLGKTDDNGLKDKPRLVFLQACRSGHDLVDGWDYGLKTRVNISGSSSRSSGTGSGENSDGNDYPDHGDKAGDDNTRTAIHDRETCVFECTDFVDPHADWTDDEDPDEVDTGEMSCSFADLCLEENSELSGDSVIRSPPSLPPRIVDAKSGPKGDNNGLHETDIEAAGDMVDTGGSGGDGSGPMPLLPFDVVPITCPPDCLVMFPISPHKYAIRNSGDGSYMLHFMHLEAISAPLILGTSNLCQYLTSVAAAMSKKDLDYRKNCQDLTSLVHPRDNQYLYQCLKDARVNNLSVAMTEEQINLSRNCQQSDMPKKVWTEAQFKNMPFKICANTAHRLTGNIRFTKKCNNSFMDKAIKWLKQRLNKEF